MSNLSPRPLASWLVAELFELRHSDFKSQALIYDMMLGLYLHLDNACHIVSVKYIQVFIIKIYTFVIDC